MRIAILAGAFALATLPAAAQTRPVYDLGDLHNDLAAIGAKLDVLHGDMAKLGTVVAPAAPAVPANWELTDHLPAKAGDTVAIPAGTLLAPVHLPMPAILAGVGMRSTMADGRGGADAGHRLAYGKGFVHLDTPGTVVQDMGFVDPTRW